MDASSYSREFLEEIWRQAKKQLPGWLFATLYQSAKPSSGGRARHRVEQISVWEKVALSEIRPDVLAKLPDDELRLAWLRLHQWFENFKRRRQAVEDIVNAAVFVLDELGKRGINTQDSELKTQAEQLQSLQKERKQSVKGKTGDIPKQLEKLLSKAPDEIMMVRDFASVGGSAAVAENPQDLDVIVRADLKDGCFQLNGKSLGVALRRFLNPDKSGPTVHMLGSPQGPFTDYVPMYDLVLRKRNSCVELLECFPPRYTGKDRVVKQDDFRNELGLTFEQTTAQIKEAGKYEKQQVGYNADHDDLSSTCSQCVFFVEGDTPADVGRCKAVTGAIATGGHSRAFIPADLTKGCDERKLNKGFVPASGPPNAVVAFVGGFPSPVDIARREPFTGPIGDVFNKQYLKPLGLERSDVRLANIIPMVPAKNGKPIIPVAKDFEQWRNHTDASFNDSEIIVALGRAASEALGSVADFTLPHPSAIRKHGNSGEIDRKLKRVKAAIGKRLAVIAKQRAQEGGDTRGEESQKMWEEVWHTYMPASGTGRFVYQHHWRGLDEDETKLSEERLFETDHSVHGDIRLEGDNGAWGFAVFLGEAKDNKGRKLNDKLIDPKPEEKLQLAPKKEQPKAWLDVGKRSPLATKPGEVGATSEKFAKFFALDSGTYRLGVARKHMVEVFLDGKYLKGRYVFQFVPLNEGRRWLIDKPEDQTPIAERKDLADTISELRGKRQRFLFWAKPGERPQKIDVRTGRVIKAKQLVEIAKADPVKRIVYGVVLDPYGKAGPQADAHNDWTPPSEIEKTAHAFMEGPRIVGFQHRKKADAKVVESWVEQYPSRADYLNAMKNQPHRVTRREFGSDIIHSGSWLLGVKLGEAEWKLYEDGEINAFSPGGFGVRTPMNPGQMPKVDFVDIYLKPRS